MVHDGTRHSYRLIDRSSARTSAWGHIELTPNTNILTTGVIRTDLAIVVVVATGVLAVVFVLVATGDLGLAVVSPVAPRVVLALVVALVVEGSPALVSAEAGHFGPARALVAAVCAQVPVVFAAAPGALGFVAA